MRLDWMSRADRRRWNSARTITDLGELMALWLEGEIASRPGYQPRFGPDEETAHLVPGLAALCRTGYVTTCSQPGLVELDVDGRWWEQRAAIQLVVTDRALQHRLVEAARTAGMIVRINDYRRGGVQGPPVVVTKVDDEPFTAFGGRIGRADMRNQWPELGRKLYAQVAYGTYLSVVASEYGPAGERLWEILALLNEAPQAR
ncbi:hypothetical protein GTY67_34420 [Streptomyces sp. SID8374]|uniref:DUF6919 domain-containing protein n=1 Tax=Streptomyces sp. SID8374 TaxID=2690354 RepID=UPI00136D9467|nr:hypothetical protein [Streptomyces sp. SID8374]MYX18445.1 hypothetical protein [Streptomyces sp. SID8374]